MTQRRGRVVAAALAVALLAACGAFAEPQPSRESVFSEAAVDWLRVYPLTPYREFWNMTIEVKDTAKDIPSVMRVVEKNGGQLTVPLQNTVASPSAATQQLTCRLGRRAAVAALKDFKKVGRFAPPLVRPDGEKIPLDEIKRKIAALARDKEAHSGELVAMPAVAALVDAVLSHLLTTQAVVEKNDAEVILNLTVQGPPPR